MSYGRIFGHRFTHLRPGTGTGLERKTVYRVRDESQSTSNDKTRLVHRIFELGVIAKGVDGALELVGGLLLLFLAPAAIKGTIFFLVQGELKEDPTDLVANLLVHNTRTVIQTRFPASAFLILWDWSAGWLPTSSGRIRQRSWCSRGSPFIKSTSLLSKAPDSWESSRFWTSSSSCWWLLNTDM